MTNDRGEPTTVRIHFTCDDCGYWWDRMFSIGTKQEMGCCARCSGAQWTFEVWSKARAPR